MSEDARAIVPINALWSVWRIFGIRRDFADRGDRSLQVPIDSVLPDGSHFSVTIGKIPSPAIDAIRDWRAQLPLALSALFNHEESPSVGAARDKWFDQRRQEVNVDDIENVAFPIFVTMHVGRAVQVLGDARMKVSWVRDDSIDPATFDKIGSTANAYLDLATGKVQASLGRLNLERLIFTHENAYLTADGKAAVSFPTLTANVAVLITSEAGWDQICIDFRTSLRKLASSIAPLDAQLPIASRWLTRALREEDTVKQFIFSFIGLEVLARKVAKARRERVSETLKADLDGLPVDELLWPKVGDPDRDPWRNLVFQFAIAAVSLSRGTAADDVRAFRDLVAVRNTLAHGDIQAVSELPANAGIDLLRRYLALTAAAQD